MVNRGYKPIKSPSAITYNLLSYPECSIHYNGDKFTILTEGRNIYHLSVLVSLFIKTYEPKLCKQKFVYNTNLYKLL